MSVVNAHSVSTRVGTLSLVATLAAAVSGASYPLIDLGLFHMGVPAGWIGLNAALPPLAWLLGTPLLPHLLRRIRPEAAIRILLTLSLLSALPFALFPHPAAWFPARFFSGGALGLVFRVVEYLISSEAVPERRAADLALYTSSFCVGAGVGALSVPFLGTDGVVEFPIIAVLLLLATGLTARLAPTPLHFATPRSKRGRFPRKALGIVAAAALFGVFEPVPYTMMPVFSTRLGVSDAWASATPAAFLVGLTVFAPFVGRIADRLGKARTARRVAMLGVPFVLMLPTAAGWPPVLMIALFLMGALVGPIYTLALADLAETVSAEDLLNANAVFGTCYAAGSMIGAPPHGLIMDLWGPSALVFETAALLVLTAVLFQGRKEEAS